MRSHFIGAILAVVAVLAFSPGLLAQTGQPSGVTGNKTSGPGGHPADLSGVWGRYMDINDRTFTQDKTPAMTPWGEERFKAATAGVIDGRLDRRDEADLMLTVCAPAGLPRIFLLGARPFEIIQIPGRVLMLFEWDHWVRQIWMDGRKHPEDPDPTWMGHSIGWWEGDTLVVDTVGFNDKTWLDQAAHPHSDQLHLVERWRRVDQEILDLQITFDDPIAYPKPWAGKRLFGLKPNWEIQEEVYCEFRGILNSPEYLPFVP